jgi:hypothetical protein
MQVDLGLKSRHPAARWFWFFQRTKQSLKEGDVWGRALVVITRPIPLR